MRIVITDRLSFGDGFSCGVGDDGSIAVVHACKDPCHRRAVGYEGTLDRQHPKYLSHEVGNHLYLNLIDPPVPLFTMESFDRFLEFAVRQMAERPLHIHCNLGQSRAPSLALLLMAKRLGLLPADTYEAAAAALRAKYPYTPGRGIQTWLASNWAAIR